MANDGDAENDEVLWRNYHAFKAFAIERSRDPAEGLSARNRALMACIVIPPEIQKWMLEVGAVEPLLDSIEKTILAAERAVPTRGQMIQAMLRARDSMGNCTALQAAEACADAALELLARAALNIQQPTGKRDD